MCKETKIERQCCIVRDKVTACSASKKEIYSVVLCASALQQAKFCEARAISLQVISGEETHWD